MVYYNYEGVPQFNYNFNDSDIVIAVNYERLTPGRTQSKTRTGI